MPNRAATDEEVASRALVMIGTKPITSFGDGTTEATAAATVYEDVVTNVMTSTRWRFCVTQIRLNKLTNVPAGRWTTAWQLPADILMIGSIHSVGLGYPVKFDRYLDKVYTDDHDDLILDYLRRVPTADWPPYFTLAVVHMLASELAIAVAQNEQLSALHAEKYDVFAARARSMDSQGRTNSVLKLDRYHRARRSGTGGL